MPQKGKGFLPKQRASPITSPALHCPKVNTYIEHYNQTFQEKFIDTYLNITIEPRGKVDIKGSGVILEGKSAIIAAEVKKGNKTLVLRDDNGVPVWAGRRQNNSLPIFRQHSTYNLN